MNYTTPPVLETIGATGYLENESKYRSGRGTGPLEAGPKQNTLP